VAPDVAPPVDAPPDAPPADGGAPDGTIDADAGALDGAMDAGAGDGLDDAPAADAGAPDAGPMLTLPVLRASGGACTCATGEGSPRPGWTLLALAALAVLARGRARSSRR
jgi:MYXO-CTERM domain-containing protein